MKNSKVIIVDDDPNIRDALNDWLSRDYIVHSFDSAESLLRAINNHNFDFNDGIPTCILLDFQMPGMTGVELQSTLRKMNVVLPIIFMSGNALQADVIDAWHGGAVDFILKPFGGKDVSTKLTKLFSDAEKLKASQAYVAPEIPIIDIPITHREAQVLQLLGKGYQQKEVAYILELSLRTVKMYRANLKDKLALNNLVDLTKYCDKHQFSIEKIVVSDKQ